MEKEIKIEKFSKELACIKNAQIKEVVTKMVSELIPDYFWEVAASSTGKYHPAYATGEGGLYRHTIAAVRIAINLFPLTAYSDDQKDMIIGALIMHDAFKHGPIKEKYTRADHPVIAAGQIKMYGAMWLEDAMPICEHIAELVLTHMGQWNTDFRSKKEIMPKPTTSEQRFVHMCDYLASRKCLEFNFEEGIKRD